MRNRENRFFSEGSYIKGCFISFVCDFAMNRLQLVFLLSLVRVFGIFTSFRVLLLGYVFFFLLPFFFFVLRYGGG